jgi:hypothetical protein
MLVQLCLARVSKLDLMMVRCSFFYGGGGVEKWVKNNFK